MKYAVVVALVGMLWLFYQQQSHTPKANVPRIQAQEYMTKISITNFTEEGNLKQKIDAQAWAFVPNEQRSKVIMPKLVVYKPSGDVWTISAKRAYAAHATLEEKIQKVEMFDDVTIKRSESQEFTPTEITSSQMQYYPIEDKVTSDVEVIMRQPDLMVSGVGMLGYLDRNWVQLLNKTTTVYDQNTIRSKQAVFDNNKGTAVYTKNVTVDNETSHLSSDTLCINRDSQNKINTLIAHGKPATYTKHGDTIAGPILTYDVASDTLFTQNSTVILQPKQAS